MNDPTDMLVIIFDFRSGGHNLQHVGYLAEYLLEQGFEVIFATPELDENMNFLPTDDSRFQIEFLESVSALNGARWVGSRQWTAFNGFRSGLNFAAAENADIIHFMSVNRVEFPLALATKLHSVDSPKAAFATLVAPYYHDGGWSPTDLRSYFHELNRRSLAWALKNGSIERLFVLSELTKELMGSEWPKFPLDLVSIAPDPIEKIEDANSKMDARNRLSLPTDKKIILFFGKLRYEKGPDILLQAIPKLPSDIYVVFAGPPGVVTETDIKETQSILNNPERLIAHLEFVAGEEVHDYFRSADAVVLPYRSEYDGTSGILQHAAASGTPTLVTDVGHIGHLVRDWNIGKVVDPNSSSAVAEGIRSFFSGGLPNVSEQTEAYVDAHHWRRWAGEIYEEYERALTER